jgi:hypothetical protein
LRKAQSEAIPSDEWFSHGPQLALAAISKLHVIDSHSRITEHNDRIIVPSSLIAQLTENEAHAIGLPPATALTLQLKSSGFLHDGTIAVTTSWVQRGGVSVRAQEEGARLKSTDGIARLPEPLFSTIALVNDLNAQTDPDKRRAKFAELREHLGDLDDSAIEPDGTISRSRIAYAASFSLDLRTHGGLFDFDPVLFSRQAQENEDGDLVNATKASLLTEAEQNKFRTKFRSQPGGKRSYLLSDGTILFLDPLLGRALDLVREQQSKTGDERKEFAKSPQRFIREQLDLDVGNDDDAADRLFVETQQYSERVAGIEVWQKPVLPWLKPSPSSWLPESFGIKVGEGDEAVFIEIEPEEAAPLAELIGEAQASGQSAVLFKDQEVPATDAAKSAAQALASIAQELVEPIDVVDGKEKPELQTFFLQVGENFETLDYARFQEPSSAVDAFVTPSVPDVVKSIPQPHQVEGFAWMSEAWHRKKPGLLLADDMGLGKTFQALMFLAWLRTFKASSQPVLIVAPTGLLRNWQAEIAMHLAPTCLGPLVEAFGSSLKGHRRGDGNDIKGGTSRLDVSSWSHAGVVLTTFETLRDYHMSFARVPFSAIVYDEIQKLKNPTSQMTRAAKTMNAEIQIGMTGTPVENRLQDLWSISDVIYPGFLGASQDFEKNYQPDDPEALSALQDRLVQPLGTPPAFMLRRMKEGMKTGLPEKRVKTYNVPMSPSQTQAYDRVLARASALRQNGEPGAMLKILHMLRGTSLHPIPPAEAEDFDSYISASARLSKTFEILEEVKAQGEKALVFCEDREMQAFLAIAVQEKFAIQSPIPIINGDVAGSKRQDKVVDFQSRPAGFDVMVLSPKAGGVGLTITAANHVIHLSRWWNPAVEDQATDRVYRIGQTRAVKVHVPMAVHPDPNIGPSSFDVVLNELMEGKRALSQSLLAPPESASDIDMMLSAVLDGKLIPVAPSKPYEKHDVTGDRPLASNSIQGNEKSIEGEKPSRPILTVEAPKRKQRTTPVEAGEARNESIQRRVFESGQQRDWQIFKQHLEGQTIEQLTIVDPYCCATGRVRRHLVEFIDRLCEYSDGVRSIHIISYDSASISSRDSDLEQVQDLEMRLDKRLPDLAIQIVQRSRHSARLHDRSVTAIYSSGQKAIWDLGGGIEALMTAKFDCTVNAFRETS